jgi:pimeloyl-ACP methyl ester carboxylesterase
MNPLSLQQDLGPHYLIASTRAPWRALRILVGVSLLASPLNAARADLTDELCGPLMSNGGGDHVDTDGKPIRYRIDTLEGRTDPVRHCFVGGTIARDRVFRILLPQDWNGRFVLGLGGGYGGNVDANTEFVTLPVLEQGYAFASSNEGRQAPVFKPSDTWPELHYIANYQATVVAKHHIEQLYGSPPSYTYLFGSSGGGWRSFALLERYPGTYDGAGMRNPAIEPRYLTYQNSLVEKNVPVFIDKLPAIVQARDRDEDPFAFLNPEEAEALQNMYDGGATVGSEYRFSPLALGLTVSLGYPAFSLFDPTYFDDFWKRPGYAGYEGELNDQIIDGIMGVVTAVGEPNENDEIFSFTDHSSPFGANDLKGWRITFTSGALASTYFHVNSNTTTEINIAGYRGNLNGLEVGDTYTLSNRDYLAWQHYHFHIAQCEFPEYAPVCDDEGQPLRVQRPPRVQRAYTKNLATMSGKISAPVVSTAQALDELVYPPVIARYFEKVRSIPGQEDMLHTYWFENTGHGSPAPDELNRFLERESSWHLAFQLMVRWVEEGIPPPPDSVVDITPGHVIFPEGAADRKGLQPTISVTVNEEARAVVAAGSPVSLDGVAASPIGNIAKYEWDFESDNEYDCDSDPATELPDCSGPLAPAPEMSTPAQYVYGNPGVFVATVRVTDDTDNPGPFDGLENLARVVIEVR